MLILKLVLFLLKLITSQLNNFSTKNKKTLFLKSFPVYKVDCARQNFCYIGETCLHFKTTNDEHVKKDKKSNIYVNIYTIMKSFFQVLIQIVFLYLDYTPTKFQIKIKGMYIDCEKPNLNKQLNHLATTLSI